MATLVVITGPTAIGKTALSIQLAQHFNTEIISCDSRQFYKEMSIGTAVPDAGELAAVSHHFIQNRSITEDYNVGQFERDALEKLSELFKKHSVVIMTGGSGLYINAVVNGLDDFPDVDETVRQNLIETLERDGIARLQEKLKALDPVSYKEVAIDNPQRLIRALEICLATGRPYSSFKNQPRPPRTFNVIKIGLQADRKIIYDRINRRTDLMMEAGLLEEATRLLPYKHLNALQTVGYKELFLYLENAVSLEEAVSEIKKNTRRFAKRQLTWFRKDASIIWFDYQADTAHIIKEIETKL